MTHHLVAPILVVKTIASGRDLKTVVLDEIPKKPIWIKI